MRIWRALLIVSLVVVAQLLGASLCASVSLPEDNAFRMLVASSDMIVVGRVAATEDTDVDVPWSRFSHLEVERALYGAASAGDTLRVSWHAQRWPTEDDGVFGEVADAVPQLDALTGVQALFLLNEHDRLKLAGWPIILTSTNAENLRARVSWIRKPPARDFLSEAFGDPGTLLKWCGTADEATIYARLESVAAYLEGYLDGIAAQQHP